MRIKFLFFIIFLTSICNSYLCIAQMVEGQDIPNFGKTFGVVPHKYNYPVSANYIKTNISGNVMWLPDSLTLTIQVINNSSKTVNINGEIKVISYGTKGISGDIWKPDMFKLK